MQFVILILISIFLFLGCYSLVYLPNIFTNGVVLPWHTNVSYQKSNNTN